MESTLYTFFQANQGIIMGAAIVVGIAVVNKFYGGATTKVVLDKEEPRLFKLIQKKSLTSGEGVLPVNMYRFEIPGNQSLGLPCGQHISISAKIGDEEVKRSYTPTSNNNDKGYFDLVIKIYPQGKMGQFIDKLVIGESISVTGPKGLFVYEKNKFKHLGMLAGGTGITPMLQVIDEISQHKDDTTKVSLIFGNLSEKDIILREKIEEYAKKNSNFTVYNVLNNPPENWTQGSGFITPDVIKKFCPAPGEGKVLMCGPGPMINAMSGLLKEKLSYTKEDYFTF